MADSYGAGPRLNALNARISRLQGSSSPAAQGRLARLMARRDNILTRQAAKKGAAMAAASIPGLSGGLASSGIRGYDLLEQEFTPETIRLHNVEGAAQGQRFSAVAPPGSGRLVPINFVVSGAVNPVHTIVGGGAAIGATTNLVTQSINWAVLRIVAVTTQSTPAATGVLGVMQDFKIGGSPNLFLVEDWVLMDDYDVDKEQFAGLRAYPVLISPNTALISVAAFAPAAQSLYATVSIVTEVLRDDAFGPGLPGPYGR